jgi:tryptophan synthase alpha chain
MGYLNPVLFNGYEAFANDASDAGADGVIIVDCPPEEADPLTDALEAAHDEPDPPGHPDHRRRPPAGPWSSRTSGFIYYVSVAGVTGVLEADADAWPAGPAARRLGPAGGRGFRHQDPRPRRPGGPVADGVVVGSALVDEIESAAKG